MLKLFVTWCMVLNPSICLPELEEKSVSLASMRDCYMAAGYVTLRDGIEWYAARSHCKLEPSEFDRWIARKQFR